MLMRRRLWLLLLLWCMRLLVLLVQIIVSVHNLGQPELTIKAF